MAEQGFPSQHTTTTTVTSNTSVQTNIRYDPYYIRTVPGMLKCGQILLNLLGFICILCSLTRYYSRSEWFNTVAMGGFWFTGIMLVFYLFHIVEKFYRIPWLKIEFVFCALWTFFYLLAASLVAALSHVSEANIVAAVWAVLNLADLRNTVSQQSQPTNAFQIFGFLAMILYGYDAFLKFTLVRSGGIAQGERVVNKSSSAATSPTY